MDEFFIYCAGADSEALKRCPRTEYIFITAIGVLVFSVGVCAMLSGGYAFYTIFQSETVAYLLGAFWGSLIFHIDRFLVLSVTRAQKGRGFLLLIRLLLAAGIAFSVARPVEVRLFEHEIRQKLSLLKYDQLQKIDKARGDELFAIQARYEQDVTQFKANRGISKLEEMLDDAKKRLTICETERQILRTRHLDECTGRTGNSGLTTGVRGDGPECKRTYSSLTERNYDCYNLTISMNRQEEKIQQVLLESKFELNEIVKKRDEQVTALAKIIEERRDGVKGAKQDSFFNQHRVLSELEAQESSIWWAVTLISCIFLMVEIAPLGARMLMSIGTYETSIHCEMEIFRKRFELQKAQAIEEDNLADTVQKMNLELEKNKYIAVKQSIEDAVRHWEPGRAEVAESYNKSLYIELDNLRNSRLPEYVTAREYVACSQVSQNARFSIQNVLSALKSPVALFHRLNSETNRNYFVVVAASVGFAILTYYISEKWEHAIATGGIVTTVLTSYHAAKLQLRTIMVPTTRG